MPNEKTPKVPSSVEEAVVEDVTVSLLEGAPLGKRRRGRGKARRYGKARNDRMLKVSLDAPKSLKPRLGLYSRKNTKKDPRYRQIVPTFMSMFRPGLGIGGRARFMSAERLSRYGKTHQHSYKRSSLYNHRRKLNAPGKYPYPPKPKRRTKPPDNRGGAQL